MFEGPFTNMSLSSIELRLLLKFYRAFNRMSVSTRLTDDANSMKMMCLMQHVNKQMACIQLVRNACANIISYIKLMKHVWARFACVMGLAKFASSNAHEYYVCINITDKRICLHMYTTIPRFVLAVGWRRSPRASHVSLSLSLFVSTSPSLGACY